MPRLLEWPSAADAPARIVIRVGDLLLVRAPGLLIEPPEKVLERLGIFTEATFGTDGRIFEAADVRHAILCRAQRSGETRLRITSGYGLMASSSTSLHVQVVAED